MELSCSISILDNQIAYTRSDCARLYPLQDHFYLNLPQYPFAREVAQCERMRDEVLWLSWLKLWAFCLCLIYLILPVNAQGNELQDPSLLQFSLNASTSATFHLPVDFLQQPTGSNTAQRTYHVTLSVCNAPARGFDQADPTVLSAILYTFDSSAVTDTSKASIADSNLGFANLTVTHNVNTDTGLWVVVNAPPMAASDSSNVTWSFELGISTIAPMHIIDPFPLWQYGDSDNTSAVLTSPTFFTTLDPDPQYTLLSLPTTSSSYLSQLAHSFCHVASNAALLPNTTFKQTLIRRGAITIGASDGGLERQREEHVDGGQRLQYVLDDLEIGTNYTAWGMQGTGQLSSTGQQGIRLFQSQSFVTKTGKCYFAID